MNWKTILVAGAILFSGDLYTQISDGTAPAKELYVIKALGFSPIQAYEILPAPDYLKLVRESPTPPAGQERKFPFDN